MNIDWSSPHALRRAPVFARNVVASSQPLAVQAGIQAMRRGGNAVDAALATAIALTVVEPTMNGIGGDAFAIVWKDGRLHGLNASGRSPAAWSPERFAGLASMPDRGWDSVTVPGGVSAWVHLSRAHGRLPFRDLFADAIAYARDGFHVSPITAGLWERSCEKFRDFAEFQRVFCPGGRAPRAGDLFRHPEQADTLAEIAETEGESFYRGALARRIAAASHDGRGAMTEDDLAAHRPFEVEPISIPFRGVDVHEIPPNGQGLAALMALGMLERFDLGNLAPDDPRCLHVQIEATKLALADAHAWIADPAAMAPTTWRDLLAADYLARRASLIDPERARAAAPGDPHGCDTVYLATADAEGTMVSFIQSNFHGFGSGVVVPGTGISLQNRGLGFSLEPGHANRVDGRKLPFHTIIPGFATRGGEPLLAFGVMGGPMQAQGHIQMMVRLLEFGQNPQAASDAPRWQALGGVRLGVEEGMDATTVSRLAAMGHAVEILGPASFGGAQFALRTGGGYVAASDHRKDGQAAGF